MDWVEPIGQLLERYDVVDVEDNYMILADPEPRPQAEHQLSKGTTEYGLSLRIDHNLEFVDIGQRTTLYREMRKDGTVRNSLRVAKSPVLSARWFVKPATMEAIDIEIADFIWDNLTQWMSNSWPQLLIESLYMLDYGFYAFEKVYDIDDQGRVIWKKMVPIHPAEVVEPMWDESDGGIAGLIIQGEDDDIEIPIDKLLIFTFDKEGGDVFGESVLRSAYKHYFFKERLLKIDAIQKERHGIGIPIIKLPVGYTLQDKQEAHRIGENLRTNERAHVVMPPGWDILFAKLEGHQVDALASAEYHGNQIYDNVMGSFMHSIGKRTIEYSEQMFLKGTRFTADLVRDVWNKYAIPQLVNWNWEVEHYPQLYVRRLGDVTDWRTLSFAWRNLAGMGGLTPDDKFEDWVRDEMDMPERDEATARIIPTPQRGAAGPRPPQAGPPRQAPVGQTSGGQGTTTGPGGANTGQDTSGG